MKTIVVGASSGIGKYLVNELRKRGDDVIGTYNNSNRGDSELKKLDVRNNSDIEGFFEDFKNCKLNVIICAGISYNAFAHKSDPTKWADVISTNLIGAYNVIREALPIMRNLEYGRIILFSSVVAIKPTPGVSAYAASKSGLWGLAKSISVENASKGVTINAINLGYSELGMINEVPAEYLNIVKESIPAKRLCDSKEILASIDFLINTSYVNGVSLDVSGGLI